MRFIDLQTVYESVYRTHLGEVLARLRKRVRTIKIIRMFRDGIRARVQLDNGKL